MELSEFTQEILHIINAKPAVSRDEIILQTGFPSFLVRSILTDLQRLGKIERTLHQTGVGRYCVAGKKHQIISTTLHTAQILSERGYQITALHTLFWLQRCFLLDDKAQHRLEEMTVVLTVTELRRYFRDRRKKTVRLYELAIHFKLTPLESRNLFMKLVRLGLLSRHYGGFALSGQGLKLRNKSSHKSTTCG